MSTDIIQEKIDDDACPQLLRSPITLSGGSVGLL